MSMDSVGVILGAGEETMLISLMMKLQNHHDVSYVKMISYWNVIDVLADETDSPARELLRDRLDDLITSTGASLIVVVDSRSGIHNQEGSMRNRERLSAARKRAQSWFPDLTVIGLSIDDRCRFLSDSPDTRLRAG